MREKAKIIVIGGSAGSYNVVRSILSALPADYPLPLVLCLHRLRDTRSGLCESLNNISKREVIEPEDKTTIRKNMVYLAPSNYHLLFEGDSTIVLTVDEEVNFSRPSIDLTFDSTGRNFKNMAVGILLSGANSDGADGLQLCKEYGSYTIIQDPRDALFAKMPDYALKKFTPDKVATEQEIVDFLLDLPGKEPGEGNYFNDENRTFYKSSS